MNFVGEPKLVRGISRLDMVAITINSIIGAGIFGLPSKAAALIGANSLFAFIACAFVVALIVLCFAEVSSRFTETGGPYLYAKEAFGSVVGFEVGWLFWLVRITAFATNCNLLVNYLGFANNQFARVLIIILVVLALSAINLVGVKTSARTTNFFTVGKLIPLFAFALIGLFFINPQNLTFSSNVDSATFAQTVLVLIYAFTGFEMAVVPSGEMKEPGKNLPFALLTAIAVVAALYILIQIVCIGTLPELAQSERPLADAASHFLGTYGAAFIIVGATISISGNLNSLLLSASRIPFAMSEQGELPNALAKTHANYKTPYVSIILTAIVMLIFTIQTSFLTALTISTITRLLVYAATCASLPVFRRRDNAPKAEFLAPLGIPAAIASLALIGWLLYNVKFDEVKILAVCAVVGLIIYFVYSFVKKRQIAPTKR
jgi:APA family basic amino acid/polyamine antiporter